MRTLSWHRALLGICLLASVVHLTDGRRRSGRRSLPRGCSVPQWPDGLDFDDPIANNRGKIVLVALMKGYCGYCVQQAESLEVLKNTLAEEDLPDIEMVLVNGGENISRVHLDRLENATTSLTVLQDTEQHVLYTTVFGGNKDDFIVYNRCGQRAFYIPHPYSYMGEDITERVLRAVYAGRHLCTCNVDDQISRRQMLDSMQGDQPVGGMVQSRVQSVSQSSAGIECRNGDTVCQNYLTEMAQGTLESRRRSNRPSYRLVQDGTARAGNRRQSRNEGTRTRGGRRRNNRRGHQRDNRRRVRGRHHGGRHNQGSTHQNANRPVQNNHRRTSVGGRRGRGPV